MLDREGKNKTKQKKKSSKTGRERLNCYGGLGEGRTRGEDDGLKKRVMNTDKKRGLIGLSKCLSTCGLNIVSEHPRSTSPSCPLPPEASESRRGVSLTHGGDVSG